MSLELDQVFPRNSVLGGIQYSKLLLNDLYTACEFQGMVWCWWFCSPHHVDMTMEAMQLQLKNACPVRMSAAFSFLAHTYYAAILSYGTMYLSCHPAQWLHQPLDLHTTVMPQTSFFLVQGIMPSLTGMPIACTIACTAMSYDPLNLLLVLFFVSFSQFQ